jgi:hypothetical protein
LDLRSASAAGRDRILRIVASSQGIASILLSRARAKHASARPTKALIAAGLVESNLRNLGHGDRDSVGVLQQRPSQGWGHAADPAGAADDFLDRAINLNATGKYKTAGQLAQAVQRSAYPERYDQRGSDAQRIIQALGGQPATRSVGTGSTPIAKAAGVTADAPDSDTAGGVAALLAATTQQRQYQTPVNAPQAPDDPNLKLAASQIPTTTTPVAGEQDDAQQQLLAGLSDILSQESSQTTQSGSKPMGSAPDPSTKSTTATSAKGLSPLRELFYQGPGGIDIKDGKVQPQGFVSGHQDHVHVAAGPKTTRYLGSLAEQMGLHVGENPAFGGVNPVHVKNSYHYKNEAIDVSGNPAAMRRYAASVARIYGFR